MDEPLSNLDAKLRTATRSELTQLHRTLGSTFVYVTHDQVEAMTMATRIALLNEGRLEQVGTPAQVYDEPASVFVAGFLGSPPMNLLDAEVADRGGELHAVATETEVPLGISGDAPARQVVLGIRPEHLVRTSGRPGLHAVVRLVENLGSEEVAHCAVGNAPICLRGPRPLGLVTGDRVGLTAATEHVHLFDRETGRRLVWQSVPAPLDATPV
jgi:multiple sugar transport system ATP-binding protein